MPTLIPGDAIAGYRIEGVAGRGGMGIVYRAVQLDLGRPVALKVIAADRAADPVFRERFQRESRMAAAIDHPNVVPVHGVGEEDGQLYLVMRYVPGIDLHELIEREGPLDPERAARIIAQVGAALDAAHAAGLVHRDVKPANVLLAGSGPAEHAYLGDFGLTRLASDASITQTGEWIGTTDFSSPEQLRGGRVDARADVYSLGCVLHAALTGAPPYPRTTVPAAMLAHLQDEPPRPSLTGAPEGFDRVIARALAKAPADRYPSAGDLARAADAAARGEPVTETERSVAVGPAAPSRANGTARPPTAQTAIAPPGPSDVRTDVHRPAPEPPRVRRHGSTGRRRAVAVGAAVAGIAAAGVLAGTIAGDGRGSTGARLTADEVREAAEAFGTAYENEDGEALRALLASDAERVLPAGVARGREQVATQYERQFAAQDTEGYDLDDLEVHAGAAGRATARYRVTRSSGPAIEGQIVFGVIRDRGRPRIALIAVTPDA